MKAVLLFYSCFLATVLLAQPGSVKPVEQEHKSSFEQYQLLILALLGLALLMGIRYWFKCTRKR